MTVRFLDEQPQGNPKGRVRFLDEIQDESQRDPSMREIAEKGVIRSAREMFQKDPSVGGAYNVASVPSRKIGEGLRSAIDKIPDPQTRSTVLNVLMGLPKMGAEVGADFAESSATPEGVATSLIPGGKMVKGAAGMVERNFPKFSQAMTGVPKKYYQRLLKNKKIILPEFLGGPKGLDEAGEALGSAEKRAFGDVTPSVDEVNDPALSFARKKATKVVKQLDDVEKIGDPAFTKQFLSDPENGKEILAAKRATQAQLDSPAAKGRQRFFLEQQRERLSGVLEKYFPEIAEDSLEYAKSISRDKLTGLLPVLKSGDPSISRMVLAAMMRSAGTPIGFSVPAVHSVTTALTGLTLDGLEKLAGIPRLRQLALAEIARRNSNANP